MRDGITIKKNKNRHIRWAAMLVLALLLCIVPIYNGGTVAGPPMYGRSDDGNWAYKILNETDRLVAVRPGDLGGIKKNTNVTIPSTIKISDVTYTVKHIGRKAFSECLCKDCLDRNRKGIATAWEDADQSYKPENIDEVVIGTLTIPSSVDELEEGSIEDVELGKIAYSGKCGIKTIGEGAFSGAISGKFTIPASVTKIGESAFETTDIPSFVFESGSTIKEIPLYAFEYSELTSITLPDSVTHINDYAFKSSMLKKIKMPASLTHMGEFAFGGSSVASVDWGSSSVKTIKKGAFMASKLSSITIPSYVTTIEDYAFTNISKLKTITFEKSSPISNVSSKAFVKISDFDFEDGNLDEIEDFTAKRNTSVTTVNVKNYDVYEWLVDEGFFQTSAAVKSEKTRVFLKTKKDSAKVDELNVGSDGSVKVDISDYIKSKKGYHYENIKMEYVDTLTSKTSTKKLDDTSTESKAYPFVVVDADVVPNNYKISYQPNANDVVNMPVSATNCKYDSDVYLSTTVPRRVGYDFMGWSLLSSGSNPRQAGANIGQNLTDQKDGIVPMYATWQLMTIKVTADANGGSLSKTSFDVKYGSVLESALEKPTRDGYDFKGWCFAKNGKANPHNYKVDKELPFTVYAKWKKNTKKMTITFSKPKRTSSEYYFEVIVTEDGNMIKSYDYPASNIGIEKIVLEKAKIGSEYVITCTNYKKNRGRKQYFRSTTKEIVVK